MKNLCLVLLFALTINSYNSYANNATEKKVFDRHFILVVDQTLATRADELKRVYDTLYNFFCERGNISDKTDITFNPETDQLSVFPAIMLEEGYTTIKHQYNNDSTSLKDKFFDVVAEHYIHNTVSDFASVGGGNIKQYFEDKVKPVILNYSSVRDLIKRNKKYSTWKSNPYNINGPVSFTHYVDQLALLNVEKDSYAKDYYLIIVTDFTAGSDGKGSSSDENELSALVAFNEGFVAEFNKKMEYYLSTISSTPIISERNYKTSIGDTKSVKMRVLHICSEVARKTSASVRTTIKLKQCEYESDNFEIDPYKIVLSGEDKFNVDSILVTVKLGASRNLKYSFKNGYGLEYSSEEKMYPITLGNLNLPDVEVGSEVTFENEVYVSVKDTILAKSYLPQVFSASQLYTLSEQDFVPPPTPEEEKLITKIVIISLVIIVLICLIYWLYVNRGKKQAINVRCEVAPISRTRYMSVQDNQVINYDCWYWKRNDESQKRVITLNGNIEFPNRTLSKKYYYLIKYCVHDNDVNTDFTFRPQGTDNVGNLKTTGVWYDYDKLIKCGDSSDFQIKTIAYFVNGEGNNHPNWGIDNILDLGVDISIFLCNKKGELLQKNPICIYNPQLRYKFIVKPELRNQGAWIAFDPGTTGSCVSYGLPGQYTAEIPLALTKYQELDGSLKNTHIFPSVLRIAERSKKIYGDESVNVEEWNEGSEKEFLFGYAAQIRTGNNKFISVKKLLGYTTPQTIYGDTGYNSNPTTTELCGKDLAHLVVKGLYNNVEDYFMTNIEIDPALRLAYVNDGKFDPQRAIVAVPNNYTLPKIQEMVDTVKRLHKFSEVHYIYESEGTMMEFCRREWGPNLIGMQNKVFVVYDMGGATINATAFRINLSLKKNNITQLEVTTISKIGYSVGGDDLDYALIQMIYNCPSIKSLFGDNEDAMFRHQLEYKDALTDLVRTIKIEWTRLWSEAETSTLVVADYDSFASHITSIFKTKLNKSIDITDAESKEYFERQQDTREFVKRYVFNHINDAIDELFYDNIIPTGADIVLIMSGRTVLYPGIKATVIKRVRDKGCGCTIWNGFNRVITDVNTGKNIVTDQFDEALVKTAVAKGACWAAHHSTVVKLNHDVITSTFGFVDMNDSQKVFVPVIKRNTKYEPNSEYYVNDCEVTYADLPVVEIVQMLGSNFNEILREFDEGRLRHKMNVISKVQQVNLGGGSLSSVEMKLFKNNNFEWKVNTSAGEITDRDIPVGNGIRIEIADYNSKPYIFATHREERKPESIIIDDIRGQKHFDRDEKKNIINERSRRGRI